MYLLEDFLVLSKPQFHKWQVGPTPSGLNTKAGTHDWGLGLTAHPREGILLACVCKESPVCTFLHIQFVQQVIKTKHSSFSHLYISQKTHWEIYKNGMVWSHQCNTFIKLWWLILPSGCQILPLPHIWTCEQNPPQLLRRCSTLFVDTYKYLWSPV